MHQCKHGEHFADFQIKLYDGDQVQELYEVRYACVQHLEKVCFDEDDEFRGNGDVIVNLHNHRISEDICTAKASLDSLKYLQ
jgi:hypothetical protein